MDVKRGVFDKYSPTENQDLSNIWPIKNSELSYTVNPGARNVGAAI